MPWLGLSLALLLVALPLLRGDRALLGFQISLCGDGKVDPGQQCDDGNLANFDGCTTGCQILAGWSCEGSPSVCHDRCGDGLVKTDFGEQCDDLNAQNRDGCSRACMIEKGWSCTGEPSHCRCATTARECGLAACGNGLLDAGEECDSGNGNPGNGTPGNVCNANCSLQKGFVCRGRVGEKPLCSRDIDFVLQEQRSLRSAAERRSEGAQPLNVWLWLNQSRSRIPTYPRARYPGRT